MYPQFGGDFCVRIDNYEPRADQLIDDLTRPKPGESAARVW
jgi:hypothetical protein